MFGGEKGYNGVFGVQMGCFEVKGVFGVKGGERGVWGGVKRGVRGIMGCKRGALG